MEHNVGSRVADRWKTLWNTIRKLFLLPMALIDKHTFWLVLVLGVFMLFCLDTQLVGFISDDGIYAISAQSLSQGLGMQMQHILTHPQQIRYPIGYPLLLAPLWWLFPDSPQNMPILSGYTLLWALLGLVLCDNVMKRVFNWPVWARLLLLVSVSSNFFFLYHATTVMSEGPYFAVTMAAILAAKRWLNTKRTRWFVALLLLTVAGFHIRIMGLAFLLALICWLALLKQYRLAFQYGFSSLGLTVLPWYCWIQRFKPTEVTQANVPFWVTISDYVTVIKLEIFANHSNAWLFYLERFQTACSDYMVALAALCFPVVLGIPTFPDLKTVFIQQPWLITLQEGLTLGTIFAIALRMLLPCLKYLPTWGGLSTADTRTKLMWLIGLYIGFYSLIITLWAYPSQSYRFLIMVLPLLWGVLLYGWVKTRPILSAALLVISCAWCVQSYGMVLDIRQNNLITYQVEARSYWQELNACYQYIKQHLAPQEVIGVGRDMPLYLHTGHKTFHLFRDSVLPGVPMPQALAQLEKQMDHYNVRYVVLELNIVNYKLGKVPINPLINDLVASHPERYNIVYQSPQKMVTLFERKPVGQRFKTYTGVRVAHSRTGPNR
jgi:hypothetical protein